jgi:hypothetical protein
MRDLVMIVLLAAVTRGLYLSERPVERLRIAPPAPTACIAAPAPREICRVCRDGDCGWQQEGLLECVFVTDAGPQYRLVPSWPPR